MIDKRNVGSLFKRILALAVGWNLLLCVMAMGVPFLTVHCNGVAIVGWKFADTVAVKGSATLAEYVCGVFIGLFILLFFVAVWLLRKHARVVALCWKAGAVCSFLFVGVSGVFMANADAIDIYGKWKDNLQIGIVVSGVSLAISMMQRTLTWVAANVPEHEGTAGNREKGEQKIDGGNPESH